MTVHPVMLDTFESRSDQVSGSRVHDDLPAFAEHLLTRHVVHN